MPWQMLRGTYQHFCAEGLQLYLVCQGHVFLAVETFGQLEKADGRNRLTIHLLPCYSRCACGVCLISREGSTDPLVVETQLLYCPQIADFA